MNKVSKIASTTTKLALGALITFTLVNTPMLALEDCTTSGQSKPDQSSTPPSTPSSDSSVSVPDFVLHAEAFPSPKLLQHPSFSLGPVTQVAVDVSSQGEQCGKSLYENIFYTDGKTLGLDRKRELGLPVGKNVSIEVGLSQCPGSQETKAAANAILRLVLDTLLNKDKVSSVKVPSYSFPMISLELQNRNARILPPGEEPPADAKVYFQLQSQGSNQSQTVYFI